ncbi:MAG: 1-acyl-sn-glycerol-3-phosphate acyltransferase [Xanthomonadaceae bacterium]|nr:1-acyl-sn-glycerol-3-phosphate acyltransferase [Xanthomonadaceae bacterium]
MGLLTGISRRAWGVWALVVFAACAGSAVVLLAFVPGLERRRALARRAAGAIFRLTGTPVEVSGLELLPPGPCIVVANHASYVDGVLMQAVLPPRFAFVVKNEMDRMPLAGFLLRRLGTEFVARFNAREGASDTASRTPTHYRGV